MKKLLLITLIFYSLLGNLNNLKAQMVYMPDPMLRLKLTNLGFGTCIVGDSIDSTCPQILSALRLDISQSSILNLEGIQAFSSLNKLDCSYNTGLSIPALPASLDTLMFNYCYTTTLLPSLPVGLIHLQVFDLGLSSLPLLPNELRTLICGRNHLTSLPTLPDSLRILLCQENRLTSIPTLPPFLQVLNLMINSVTSLPSLPSNLNNLNCSFNNLSTIPFLPPLLDNFNCFQNLITTLPSLPSTLSTLSCGRNQLTILPTLPQLWLLECTENLLTSLPTLPNGLGVLQCGNNLISTLPAIPATVQAINCAQNYLTSLPALPASLRDLDARENQITSLPSLPSGTRWVDISHNDLQSIPSLPLGFQALYCNANQITSLPTLPSTVNILKCDSNLLTSIPVLPTNMNVLSLKNNFQLVCLPQLTNITLLDFSNCQIGCLPNYGNVVTSNPPLNSLPLCDISNSNGCDFFWNISGKTFNDSDFDCNQSLNEIGLRNLHLILYENGNLIQQAFTGGEGFYSFDVNSFNNFEVQLDTTDIPFTSICPSSNSYLDTISISDSLIYGNDFALKCKSGFDIGVWSIVASGFRPAGRTVVNVRAGDLANFYGVHCANGVSGTLIITINGSAHYYGPVAGALTPSNVTGNIITYNITDFGLINSNSDFAFELETDTNAISGSQICIVASFLPTVGDYNFSNDSLTNCFTVRASFDPNDKQVYPAGITDTSQHWLTYTIRFQNTGTAPADNIYILDSLDNNLDISSFKLLAYSHALYAQILEGGIARFNFPNINLPDSNANEPLSHGYVQYKIKLKDSLAIGTQIQNTAYIYFDFNAPVVTNTTSNTIDIVNGIISKENLTSLNIWPIPFENNFTIQTDLSSIGSHFSIVNLLGSEIDFGEINSTQMKINSESWSSGIYFLRIENINGIEVKKLIKK